MFKWQRIWLVNEKFSNRAQDNGFFFFKYCYNNQKRQKTYFVIKENSPDFYHLQGFEDRVLHFMSIKHNFYLLVSSAIISSESKGHGYIWRASRGNIRRNLNLKPFVFLQHGVLGLKKIDDIFHVKNVNNRASLFITSTYQEADLVHDYFKYQYKNIAVTGLARWDEFRNDETVKGQILYTPTWRTWLEDKSDKCFIESNYYHSINNLIRDKTLQKSLKDKGYKMKVYLHPKLAHGENFQHFESDVIEIINPETIDLNVLIRTSEIFITDYSSVAWEFVYQKKPVLFYQFDQEEYEKHQGSYINIEETFPNCISTTVAEVTDKINDISESDSFVIDSVFPFHDQNNAKRTFEAIESGDIYNVYKVKFIDKLRRNGYVKIIWRKLSWNYRLKHSVKKIVTKYESMTSS